MSLPRTQSLEAANDRDSSSREGWLIDASLPELLARAYRVAFSGSLILEPTDTAPSGIGFDGGSVVGASGPFRSSELEWEVLGRFLPPDSLEFAARHADEYGLEPLAAVERLLLLPSESLDSARQALTAQGVEAMCGFTGDVRYAFVAPSESAETPSDSDVSVEPLGLLAACFLAPSQRERAARSVAALDDAVLSVDPGRSRRVLATLHGPVRAVLECLVRSPRSVPALRELGIVADDQLVACVCALYITREVALRSDHGSSTRPDGTVPRATEPGDSVPPFSPATSSMPPPRRASGFIRAKRAGAERGAKEHAMVQRVEEAWMKAEADPERAQQISGVVLKAVSVFPKNPRLRYYLARLHIQANRVEEAVKELEQVLELEPSDAQAASELERLRAMLER